ncbi:phosphoribosylglycinamide formyltransferase [Parasalinivibrio latis]|uniref:phosphoribosylglycinamide formyltransferase n=1 Tax=Parasalinivibrio latis TaxID=2952610 RepID=UPI0030E1D863
MKNILVLVSGNGTNLQALMDACGTSIKGAQIRAVISNKADAFGLERARQAGVEAVAFPVEGRDRESYDLALSEVIDRFEPDLIILAGFMRILTPGFVQKYLGRMLNIHPSLLPKYTGLNTHQRAIDAEDLEHGASVHFVTEELDGGPVVLQARVPVFEGDTAEELQERVQDQEYRIYPLVANWFVDGRLEMRNGTAWLDGNALPQQGYASE